MSNTNLPALIDEISHEISRDEKGWYFTQRAAALLSGMDWKNHPRGLAGRQTRMAGNRGSKMVKSIAAQGLALLGWNSLRNNGARAASPT